MFPLTSTVSSNDILANEWPRSILVLLLSFCISPELPEALLFLRDR